MGGCLLTGALHAVRVRFTCSNGLEATLLTVARETSHHARSCAHAGKANVYRTMQCLWALAQVVVCNVYRGVPGQVVPHSCPRATSGDTGTKDQSRYGERELGRPGPL